MIYIYIYMRSGLVFTYMLAQKTACGKKRWGVAVSVLLPRRVFLKILRATTFLRHNAVPENASVAPWTCSLSLPSAVAAVALEIRAVHALVPWLTGHDSPPIS